MESKLAGFAILLLLHVAMAIPTLDGMKEGSGSALCSHIGCIGCL